MRDPGRLPGADMPAPPVADGLDNQAISFPPADLPPPAPPQDVSPPAAVETPRYPYIHNAWAICDRALASGVEAAQSPPYVLANGNSAIFSSVARLPDGRVPLYILPSPPGDSPDTASNSQVGQSAGASPTSS